ncbi:MAG: enoyl-CoA hydratase/isomerase family protein [Deltaproteobacteria bacterium]|nr:enoyl-CoA hydratase/isomerase family protein [Deltaproteobacteria bacterium]
MDFKHIKYEVQNRIALITLNRPDQMNAWTVTMMNELIEALGISETDDHIRVVVVTGAGRAFCAGADLSAGGFNVNPKNEGERTAHRDTAGRATLVMYDMKKPIIAAINGPAVGVGMTMTLAMDVRIAADNVAKMGFIFNRRGIVPEGCSTFFLPRIVGISLAAELILTGRLFSSSEALDMGLVSRIVPAEALLETAMGLADEIAENTSAISTALALFAREDCREGVMSFLEKRPARFSMRPSTDMPEYYPWWQEHCFKV